MASLPGMTWRRFLTLVRGFSAKSVTVARMASPDAEVRVVEGKAAQAAFVALFGRGKRRRPRAETV